jgi:hypothetical protein
LIDTTESAATNQEETHMSETLQEWAGKSEILAPDFFGNTGDTKINIRVGVHVGRVRIIENDLSGMMVNYTERVESAVHEAGIALSNEAKNHIDAEKDSRHKGLAFVDFSQPLKSFTKKQMLWRAFIDPVDALFFPVNKPFQFSSKIQLPDSDKSSPSRRRKGGSA